MSFALIAIITPPMIKSRLTLNLIAKNHIVAIPKQIKKTDYFEFSI